MRWYIIILIGFVSAVVVDCSSGHKRSSVAVVTGKYYVPEQTSYNTDSEGHVTTSTRCEEWRVTSSDIETGDGFDSEVRRGLFAAITNGQIVTVTFRVGRLTGIRYLNHLIP